MTPPLFYRSGEHFTHCHRVTLNTGHHALWSREDTDAEAMALARTIVKGVFDRSEGNHELVCLGMDPQPRAQRRVGATQKLPVARGAVNAVDADGGRARPIAAGMGSGSRMAGGGGARPDVGSPGGVETLR
jgi:hypothetical protein